MGNIRGFLEFDRLEEAKQAPQERTTHWHEFVSQLDDAQAERQAARCMDCGIPFCHQGCPVNNIIPDFNDLVYQKDWKRALDVLSSTNNFPEFTGRICPAPCEEACTLNIRQIPVGIKAIEHKIIDKGWEQGWVLPQPSDHQSGKSVAVVGSGPAGLACAQQLARAGHAVTVFEQHDRLGGLLRYGIPDFKLDKHHIDRRITQMEQEGVRFRTSVYIGNADGAADLGNVERLSPAELDQQFDAIVMAGGAKQARDLPIPGRHLNGVHFAMDFLPQQNHLNAGDGVVEQILATGKPVVVIGGGDTGSDCVGTSNRQGASSVTQIELMPRPPEHENSPLIWPYWPVKLRTSSSHQEGCERDWSIATKNFVDDGHGNVKALRCVRLQWKGREMSEIAGSEFHIPAELVLLAMGFVSPEPHVVDAFGVAKSERGNVLATTEGEGSYYTSADKIFAAGDMRRGQSLVVWAIREGRQCARSVDKFLMGATELPR